MSYANIIKCQNIIVFFVSIDLSPDNSSLRDTHKGKWYPFYSVTIEKLPAVYDNIGSIRTERYILEVFVSTRLSLV